MIRTPTARPPGAGATAPPRVRRRAELLDPCEDGRWEAFVARQPAAAVFHHRGWLDLLRRTYKHPIVACCVVDAAGEICAGVPLVLVRRGRRPVRLACLPCSEHCAPLPNHAQDPELATELVMALDELRRTMGIPAEIRGPVAPHPAARVSARYRAYRMALGPDADVLTRRLRGHRALAHAASVAARDGFVIERRTDAGALRELHRLQLAERRRQGRPVPPRRFTLGFAELFDRGLGFVLELRRGRRTVAAALFASFNRTLVLRCAVNDAVHAPERADGLLLLEAIRRGCDAGMRTLELGLAALDDQPPCAGGTDLDVDEDLLEYHELRDDRPPASAGSPGRWAAPLIRYSPPVVGRIVAEAQFRRFA